MSRNTRRIGIFAIVLLVVEFVDEFTFGIREAAWPLIRDDLSLDYGQVGWLLGLPAIVSSVVEPFLGILGDVWRRRALVVGGGLLFTFSLLITAASQSYWVLMLSFVLLYPASGAFVSLSQATLMDTDPSRHEQNMARWTFAGSLGVVGGTLIVSASAALNLGWRWLFAATAILSLVAALAVGRFRFPVHRPEDEPSPSFKAGVRGAAVALRRRDVLRWLTLLQFSDLMLDVLLGYLALYFVDVVGTSPETAALAVTAWTVVGLVGDFLMIPLLERVRGLSYLRLSAAAELILFPAFLLVSDFWAKVVLIGLLGLFNAGWYSILQGNLYSSMPGQSGTVMTLTNVFGLVGGLLPLALGLFADNFGLGAMMWLLLAGPVTLFIGLPRRGAASSGNSTALDSG
jgi:FSR family fosmidomycin resistance protein-like MFS transporter